MDPAEELQILTSYLWDQRIILDYAYVAPVAIVMYDLILTLHLEVTLVWFSPWNYTKVLYLLTRYLPLVGLWFAMYDQLWLNPTVEFCVWSFPFSTWLGGISVIVAECILMIRTWAIWRQNRYVGYLTLSLMCMLGISMYWIADFLKSIQVAPPPFVPFRGCFIVAANGSLYVSFTIMAVVDGIVLVLMLISGYRAYKSSNVHELSNIVHRDAIQFYIYLMVCTTASTCVVQYDQPLLALLLGVQISFYSVLTCRVILNMRSVQLLRHSTEVLTDLHSTGGHVLEPIAFALSDASTSATV